VGSASQPLLAFYGLSQAGRAVAAASTAAGGEDWRLRGHGITVSNLDARPNLAELIVKDKTDRRGTGSFTQLASLLRSGTLRAGAPLGQVWVTLPDLIVRPLGPRSHRVYARPEARADRPLRNGRQGMAQRP
jgi:hypothetical protein